MDITVIEAACMSAPVMATSWMSKEPRTAVIVAERSTFQPTVNSHY